VKILSPSSPFIMRPVATILLSFGVAAAVCREIVDQEELNTCCQRVNETLAGHNARVIMDRGRFLILRGTRSSAGSDGL
jgi:hypothetical protein